MVSFDQHVWEGDTYRFGRAVLRVRKVWNRIIVKQIIGSKQMLFSLGILRPIPMYVSNFCWAKSGEDDVSVELHCRKGLGIRMTERRRGIDYDGADSESMGKFMDC